MYDLGQPFTGGDDDEEYAAYCSGPFGYTYYLLACLSQSTFLGCCTDFSGCANSCENGDIGNFSISSFDDGEVLSFTSKIQEQTCLYNSEWYTCNESTLETNFIGCCTTNPCHDGCPEDNLLPAFLAPDASAGKFFYPLNESSMEFCIPTTSPYSILPEKSIEAPVPMSIMHSTTSTSSSSSSMKTTSAKTHDPTSPTTLYASAISTYDDASDSSYDPSRATKSARIGGLAAGCAVVLLVILALIIVFIRRRNRKRAKLSNGLGSSAPLAPEGQSAEPKYEIGGDSVAVATPRLGAGVEKKDDLGVIPSSPSLPVLPKFTYTAYSRPFTEMETAVQHELSGEGMGVTVQPICEADGGGEGESSHPFLATDGSSGGPGQAR